MHQYDGQLTGAQWKTVSALYSHPATRRLRERQPSKNGNGAVLALLPS